MAIGGEGFASVARSWSAVFLDVALDRIWSPTYLWNTRFVAVVAVARRNRDPAAVIELARRSSVRAFSAVALETATRAEGTALRRPAVCRGVAPTATTGERANAACIRFVRLRVRARRSDGARERIPRGFVREFKTFSFDNCKRDG